jgi:transcriptional regulator with XRE-family HTH domain
MYVELYAERVKALREERGMTRRDLAGAAGVSPKTAGNAERSEPVRSKTARKVAVAFGGDPPQRLGHPSQRPWAHRRDRGLRAPAIFARPQQTHP